MHVQATEVWVSAGNLVMKVEVWGSHGEWRVKRYCHLALSEIPDEVLDELQGHRDDMVPEEDHHQTALF